MPNQENFKGRGWGKYHKRLIFRASSQRFLARQTKRVETQGPKDLPQGVGPEYQHFPAMGVLFGEDIYSKCPYFHESFPRLDPGPDWESAKRAREMGERSPVVTIGPAGGPFRAGSAEAFQASLPLCPPTPAVPPTPPYCLKFRNTGLVQSWANRIQVFNEFVDFFPPRGRFSPTPLWERVRNFTVPSRSPGLFSSSSSPAAGGFTRFG